MVLKSKELWENNSVFQPFYYRTSRIVAYSKAKADTLNSIDGARSSLNLPIRKRYTLQYLKERFLLIKIKLDLIIIENKDDSIIN